MLAEAEAAWDGVARLDRMAVDYFNSPDTPLNRACGAQDHDRCRPSGAPSGLQVRHHAGDGRPGGYKQEFGMARAGGDEYFSDGRPIW